MDIRKEIEACEGRIKMNNATIKTIKEENSELVKKIKKMKKLEGELEAIFKLPDEGMAASLEE